MITFPDDFLWGAATSSHQVEGNATANDWWQWEQAGGGVEPSGQACGHYERFHDDFDIAQKLNHNAHRFSIEWSRVNPSPGTFSTQALSHYKDVVLALRERGIAPVVTLHHFTNPLWFSRLGGWTRRRNISHFLRYAEVVVQALAADVRYWVTVNEPVVYAYNGYLTGLWPPQHRSLLQTLAVLDTFKHAHVQAYRLIHDHYRSSLSVEPVVTFAHNVISFQACSPRLADRLAVWLRDASYNQRFLAEVAATGCLDAIGLNYYTRNLVDTQGWSAAELFLRCCRRGHATLPANDMGWEHYPRGLYELLLRFGRYRKPVLILENGTCVADDQRRWEFIAEHVRSVHAARTHGVDVAGYFYWSLLDNYEWDKGFGRRFGLVEVDRRTQRRTVRESGLRFAEVCRTGLLA